MISTASSEDKTLERPWKLMATPVDGEVPLARLCAIEMENPIFPSRPGNCNEYFNEQFS